MFETDVLQFVSFKCVCKKRTMKFFFSILQNFIDFAAEFKILQKINTLPDLSMRLQTISKLINQ